MPASPPQRDLELQFTLTGTLMVPAGSQPVLDVHGNICEVRLPNGLLVSLFAQAYVQRHVDDERGERVDTLQLETLGCWIDDRGHELRTRMDASMLTLDELPDLPEGPALPASRDPQPDAPLPPAPF